MQRVRMATGLAALALLAALAGGAVAARSWFPGMVLSTVALPADADALAVDDRVDHAFLATRAGVVMLDTGNGAVLRTVTSVARPWAVVASASTGRVLVIGAQGTGLLDSDSGDVVRTSADSLEPEATVIDPRTGFVSTSDQANTGETLRDARDGWQAHAGAIDGVPSAVALDEQSEHVFITKGDADSATVLDARTGAPLVTDPVARTPHVIAVAARAGHVFVGGSGAFLCANGDPYICKTVGSGISMLDARSGRLLHTTLLPLDPQAAAVDEQTGRVFVLSAPTGATAATRQASLVMLDAATGRIIHTIAVDRNATALAVDARARRVFVATVGATDVAENPIGVGSVSVLDERSGAVLRTVPVGVNPFAMAVDSRAHRILVLNSGGAVPAHDRWSWIIQRLQRVLPFLHLPRTTLQDIPPSVTILDTSR